MISNCINSGYEPNVPRVQSYTVPFGGKTEIRCIYENQRKPTSWRRMDGRPLPRGSHLNGGILTIDVTTHDAAGYYECTVRERGNEIAVAKTEIIVIGRISYYSKLYFKFNRLLFLVNTKNYHELHCFSRQELYDLVKMLRFNAMLMANNQFESNGIATTVGRSMHMEII